MSSAPLYRAAPTPRHFRRDPVPQAVVDRLLDLACLAPSVGNSRCDQRAA
jgi:5,6-dimethylbenzimidazole synthase